MEGGLSPKKVKYISKMYFHGVFKGHGSHAELRSQNTCTNQLPNSIVFGCLSPSFCTGSS